MPKANNQSLANGLGVNPLVGLSWERVGHQRVSLAVVGAPFSNLLRVDLYVDPDPWYNANNRGSSSGREGDGHRELFSLTPGVATIVPFGHAKVVIAVNGEDTVVVLAIRGAGNVGTRVIPELRLEYANFPLAGVLHKVLNKRSIFLLEEEPVVIGFAGNAGASDAGALSSCGETEASKPGVFAVLTVLMNGIVGGLIVDTDAQGAIVFEADSSKVGVMGGRNKLLGKFTLVPLALVRAPAALDNCVVFSNHVDALLVPT